MRIPGRAFTGWTVAALGLVTATWLSPPLAAQSASEASSTVADVRLLQAIDLYTGVAGRVDDAAARRLLEEAAADGGVLARMWIARVHSRGRMTFPRDEPLARSLADSLATDVRGLAASGDVEALFLMGTAYDEGLGVPVDHAEAMRWYRRAAARGHVLAAHNLGNMYREGRGVAVDHGAAARWWMRAARAGDAIPALRLGEAYEEGRGVRRDEDTARLWYRRAAEKGNAAAAEALRRLAGSSQSPPSSWLMGPTRH
ncbi:MAG: tetratricopeptide repeat protein [Longimicrobiales bacterium]|nr:tetratricopeptide repeat protein [Longimicrobiales bacterium]